MPSVANLAPLCVTLKGPLPEAVYYLHGLVSRGLGDTYGKDYVEIEVCTQDRQRYPTLERVKSVVLRYRHCTIYKRPEGIFGGPCVVCGRSGSEHLVRWGDGNAV